MNRFLVSKKYYQLAKKLIKDIAKVNNKVIGQDFTFSEQMVEINDESINTPGSESDNQLLNSKKRKRNMNYLDLFRYNSLKKVTIGGSIMYFSIQYVYYGSIFAINNLAGNLYLNCFYLGLSEFIGYVVSSKIIHSL